jgi:hypothetical protein
MGLYAFEIARISRLPLPKPFTAMAFGHPDILATPQELRFLGALPSLGEGEKLDRAVYKSGVVGNAHRLFEAMGGTLTVADIYNGYGVDRILDLNVPQRVDRERFDLVIDPGTSEHCFNVGQALLTMAEMVKPGGFIYHMVPLCHWNHGFWNFSPCAFADFYEQNGFRIVEMQAEYRGQFQDVMARKKFEIPTKGRKLNLMCIGQRVRDQRISFPVQYKFVTVRP